MGRFRGLPGFLLLVLSFGAPNLGAAPASQNSAAQSLPFTPQFMGMHTLSPTHHWPTVPFGSIRPAGVSWGAVEPSRGVFNWQGMDTWVGAAQAHHVQFDYLFLNTPQWASLRPNEKCNRGMNGCGAAANDADWTQFLTALVTRYKGRIASYEMWNEPNAIGYFTGNAAEMAHLVSVAYPIIKGIDPQAIVVGPSPSSTGWPTKYDLWLDQFLAAGGGKYVDAIAWHDYPGRANQPALPPEDVINQIVIIRSVLAKYGLSGLPLWDTEGGWGNDSQVPEDQQPSYLARWYLVQFSYGISRVFWYQWDNATWGTLFREGEGPTPAAAAYAQVYNWLNGATGSTPCAVDRGSVWTCDILKNGTKDRVVWATSGNPGYTNIQGFSTYTDLSGAKHAVDGKAVAVGSSPIFFQP
jgi:hypothetical protein